MKIGVFASVMTPTASPDRIADLGRRAEDAGIDSIWMGEHVALFDEMKYPYPGTADGKLPVPPGGGLPDTVVTLAYLAAVTRKVRLGTGVVLLPQRNPIYTANEFATLDYLTGGRIDLGIGVGWCQEEVEVCGYRFEDRGERCDEMLELLRMLWSEPVTNFNGKHYQVKGCRMDPKPVQQPLPIFVGGFSEAAIRRSMRFGAGWLGFGLDPASAKGLLQTFESSLKAAGRDRAGFEIVIAPRTPGADAAREFRDLGVDRLLLMVDAGHPDGLDQAFRRIDDTMRAVA